MCDDERETGMTEKQFNAFLELIARLIEVEAKTPAEAAAIVRETKTTNM